MKLTIYHNPRCSKSRKTLQILQERGIEPDIRLYLDEPPAAATLIRLAALLGQPLQALLRRGEDEFRQARASLDLDDEQALADWLERHPRVLERPIVVDEDSSRAVMGRPPENVLDLLAP